MGWNMQPTVWPLNGAPTLLYDVEPKWMNLTKTIRSQGDISYRMFPNWRQIFSGALTPRCISLKPLQIKHLVSSPFTSNNPEPICIQEVMERDMASEVRSRLAAGNEQRPSSLSGIDCLYKSREMREIWPPLDWLESLTDRIITRRRALRPGRGCLCDRLVVEQVYVRDGDG